MANRHLSRSIAMQSLFEADFNNNLDASKIDSTVRRNIKEFAPGLEESDFIKNLIGGVLKNQKKIDAIIEKAAPEWPLDQIAVTDRNVLRIGLYELVFCDKKEVPSKVAINEAIELAKTFGGESSGRFVNGVLGTVYRELGLETKEETKMLEEKLAGAVVYRLVLPKAGKDNKNFLFAFVHDIFGYWTLSKGHIEEKENAQEGAIREIKEELGIDIQIEKEIGTNDYIASDPEKGKIKKIVTYFLASTKEKNLKLKKSGGLDNAKWVKIEELADLKIYDDIKPILAKAVKILTQK